MLTECWSLFLSWLYCIIIPNLMLQEMVSADTVPLLYQSLAPFEHLCDDVRENKDQ